jgi:hypothetical protein
MFFKDGAISSGASEVNGAAGRYFHREEIVYREETRGKLCHADVFSLLTIENYINSLFY